MFSFQNIDWCTIKVINYGGGGTSFKCIFEYIQKYMQDSLPVSIVILTDGYAPFPEEIDALGIPVLWVINNEEVTPPWGRVLRVKDEEADL